MKIYMIHVIICVLASFCSANVEDKYNYPMILVYYPNEQVYALSDLDTILHTESPGYTKVIFMCPLEHELPQGTDKLYEVKNIASKENVKEMAKHVQCKESTSTVISHVVPSINIKMNMGLNLYGVTYIILNDSSTETILRENELENFPSSDFFFRIALFEIYIFLIKYDASKFAAKWTYHRIGDYNVAKKEQKFCKCKYRNFGIGGIWEYDVLWPFKQIYKDEMKENFQWPEGEDLIPHQLVPMDDFTDDYSRLATCTYMNIIPVWKSIAVGPLRRIERYIRCVTTKLPKNTISVKTLAIGILELPSKGSWFGLFSEFTPVFMDYKRKKIPVPRVVVKIVFYRRPYLAESGYGYIHPAFTEDVDACYMVIVVHNEVNNDNVREICKGEYKVNCEEYGWHVTSKSLYEKVYCCSLSSSFFEKYIEDHSYRSFSPFDLKKVAFDRENDGRVENIFEKIVQKGCITG